jgi:hypothetical protein
MRALLLALAITGCGGGPSIPPPDPKVTIQSTSCSVDSFSRLNASLTYEVTIDVGQGFEATVNAGPTGNNPFSSFSCGSWNHTFIGGNDVGCERLSDFDPETVSVNHMFTLDNAPTVQSIQVLGSALDFPGSDIMIANAGQTVPCAVP